tara:strand:- start:6416 stop:7018 length:603 start_codon:yes stop_codon:yes gene_type:complete
MKYFLIEPTYKKSVVEYNSFVKVINGVQTFATLEEGYRWGSWMFSVPETDAEIKEFINSKEDVNSLQEYLDWFHGVSEEEFNEMDTIDLAEYMLPDPEDDTCLLTEDYEDAEMIDMWDGCWSYWNVKQHGESDNHLSEEEREKLAEAVEELYNEDYTESLEAEDWEHCDFYTEIHCNIKIAPCNSNGKTEEQLKEEVIGG